MKLPRQLMKKLGLRPLMKELSQLRAAREVRQLAGKSVLSQLREIGRLRFGSGRLDASGYYMFGVYDDARFPSHTAKQEVVGWSPRVVAARLNKERWRAICDDKLVFYAILKGLDFPFSEIYAVYCGAERSFGSVPSFSTPDSMAEFLRDGMRYPFFGKTVDGMQGRGATLVRAYDRASDRLHLAGGEEIGVEEYVREYVMRRPTGYLCQALIRQHPLIDQICGGRVGSLRMVVLKGEEEGPRLFRSIWKISAGESISDHFLHGTRGNMVGHVDPGTGVVGRVIRINATGRPSAGAARRLATEVHVHSDTHERVSGITLPDWERTVSLCLKAAIAFPGIRHQAWDIAMGEKGPSILELNFRGAIDLIQFPGVRGFNDAQFQAFFTRYAANGK